MRASGWPITLVLFCLFGSEHHRVETRLIHNDFDGAFRQATSLPVSIYTSAPPLPLQISSPSSAILPSLPFPSASLPPSTPSLISNSGESTEEDSCPLTLSPSTLVVRFGDPVKANCSLRRMGFPLIGWEVPLEAPNATGESFLVWSVENMTQWSVMPICWALTDFGQCQIKLPLKVFKPPGSVSFGLVNQPGPQFESGQYTLRCTVQDVAPVENLIVTFYRGKTVLGQLKSNNTEKTPVNEIFTLNINTSKEDDAVPYWCEAKLELGPEGPQHPTVVKSQKLFLAKGFLGHKHSTMEVEVLPGSGTSNSCIRHFLLAVSLFQMITWL